MLAAVLTGLGYLLFPIQWLIRVVLSLIILALSPVYRLLQFALLPIFHLAAAIYAISATGITVKHHALLATVTLSASHHGEVCGLLGIQAEAWTRLFLSCTFLYGRAGKQVQPSNSNTLATLFPLCGGRGQQLLCVVFMSFTMVIHQFLQVRAVAVHLIHILQS